MTHLHLLLLYFSAGLWTVSSSVWMLNQRVDCSQLGLAECKIMNCSDKEVTHRAPNGPDWGPEHVGVAANQHENVPIMNVTWTLKSDAGVMSLSGSEINILDVNTSRSMCVRFAFHISTQLNPIYNTRWTFSLDGVVVELEHTYAVSVVNLPEPKHHGYRIRKTISIPGCGDRRLYTAQMCRENGSLWEPNITSYLSVDWKNQKLFVAVDFKAAEFSERYHVSLQSQSLLYSQDILKENRTSLNVTFEVGVWQLSQCEILLSIQPFFIRCKNECRWYEEKVNYCPYFPPRTFILKAVIGLVLIWIILFYFLWRATRRQDSTKEDTSPPEHQPVAFQLQKRRRVLVIYSLDHPLYKNIVLKLCGFLAAKCSTEVVLDLLDSVRLGVLGRIQWLDWHREQIERSSDKILILCSPGVQAKWRAMCGEERVVLREDAKSPAGDMLTPALCLLIPHFIRSASFEKFLVAYFDEVCSEEDVPSPFNITVRYKLMKQFEELFFRILDAEKHQPGRVNHVQGLSEAECRQCPSGRALQRAIEAFSAYQREHPHWFQEELLERSEAEGDELRSHHHIIPDPSSSCHVDNQGIESPAEGLDLVC